MKLTYLISEKGIGIVGLLFLAVFFARAPEFALAADTSPPTAPTALIATTSTSSQVDLAWSAATDPESGISKHVIYRSTESFTNETRLSRAITRIGNVLNYVDNDPITGEDYYYAGRRNFREATKNRPKAAERIWRLLDRINA